MKIHLTDGTTVEKPFEPENCTGYIASSIEMSAADIEAIHALAHTDTDAFCQSLFKLYNCFQEICFDSATKILQ